ncbi:1757_t:CDS:2, partial [Acaulospora morrowiae]
MLHVVHEFTNLEMKHLPKEQDVLKDFEKAKIEQVKIKQQVHDKLLLVSSTSEIQSKSSRELEDDYHKVYLSRIHLAEKYLFARQLNRLTHNFSRLSSEIEETPKRTDSDEDEETWRRNMQKLDWDLFNTPMAIRTMSEAWMKSNDENLLSRWYWQLKNCALEAQSCRPSNKLSSASENLLYNVIVYDISYSVGIPPSPRKQRKSTSKMLKFSTRYCGHIVLTCVFSEENGESFASPRYDIKFDYPLERSTKMFREMIRECSTSKQQEHGSITRDLIQFVKN